MLLFGGLGWDQDEALRLILYAGDNRVLARNADLLTDFGSWRILVPITIVAAVYLAFTRRIRAALLLFTVFGGRLLVALLKVIVDRDRTGDDQHLEAVHPVRFPSGHIGIATCRARV